MKNLRRILSILFLAILTVSCVEDNNDELPQRKGAAVLTGEAAPTDKEGEDGDIYLNFGTQQIFVKKAGTWEGPFTLKGESGTVGTKILKGIGAPSITIGKEGDYYIDSETAIIYGPKTKDFWGSAIDLIAIVEKNKENTDEDTTKKISELSSSDFEEGKAIVVRGILNANKNLVYADGEEVIVWIEPFNFKLKEKLKPKADITVSGIYKNYEGKKQIVVDGKNAKGIIVHKAVSTKEVFGTKEAAVTEISNLDEGTIYTIHGTTESTYGGDLVLKDGNLMIWFNDELKDSGPIKDKCKAGTNVTIRGEFSRYKGNKLTVEKLSDVTFDDPVGSTVIEKQSKEIYMKNGVLFINKVRNVEDVFVKDKEVTIEGTVNGKSRSGQSSYFVLGSYPNRILILLKGEPGTSKLVNKIFNKKVKITGRFIQGGYKGQEKAIDAASEEAIVLIE